MKLKPCPFCGSTDMSYNMYSITPYCYVACEKCGASISSAVPWGDMNEKQHDSACREHLAKLWNRRTDEDPCKACRVSGKVREAYCSAYVLHNAFEDLKAALFHRFRFLFAKYTPKYECRMLDEPYLAVDFKEDNHAETD